MANLTLLSLTARMLKQEGQSGTNAEYLRKILADIGRLERIVKEVREYVDLPIPSLRVEDLGALMGRVARSMRSGVEAREVEAGLCAGRPDRPGRREPGVDAMLLEKALCLLVANALEAMPQGGTLTLNLTGDQHRALMAVTDTGRGIANEDLPFLFDPFFTTKADAVGISLSIVKRIAYEHGGEISASSELGRGYTFILVVPPTPGRSRGGGSYLGFGPFPDLAWSRPRGAIA